MECIPSVWVTWISSYPKRIVWIYLELSSSLIIDNFHPKNSQYKSRKLATTSRPTSFRPRYLWLPWILLKFLRMGVSAQYCAVCGGPFYIIPDDLLDNRDGTGNVGGCWSSILTDENLQVTTSRSYWNQNRSTTNTHIVARRISAHYPNKLTSRLLYWKPGFSPVCIYRFFHQPRFPSLILI